VRLEFLEEAEQDLLEVAAYYEAKEPGLGHQFRNEISRVCSSIMRDPCLWRERDNGYRRVNCPAFPYYVPYFIRKDVIIVAAIAHNKRGPTFWIKR
jgi:plasmid stabilization system protein ParE